MKKNIVLLTLSGCDLCNSFRALLKSNNIHYHEVDANENAVLSDKIEATIGVYTYPIIILTDDTADVSYCYRTVEPSLVGPRTLSTGDFAFGFHTLGELFNHINK